MAFDHDKIGSIGMFSFKYLKIHWEVFIMKKQVAKFLTLSLVVSSVIVSAPSPLKVDVVSAATNETTTTTTTTTTTKPTTTTTSTQVVVKEGDQVYTVVKGDVLWKIAKKFNLTLDELLKLNPQIKNKNLIFAGQKIIVGKKAAPVATTPATTTTPTTAKKLYHGFGELANYRFKGNGNLNITTASVIFDQDGKIVDLTWDVMEISDKIFAGWADPKLDSAAQAELKAKITADFETKREELDNYGMKKSAVSGKEWWEQLNYYESFFKGMTVSEVEAWVAKYTDPVNKRPYKLAYPEKLTDADKTAIANFTDKEKEMLVDVTTSATMSLQDDHSLFIDALKEAYAAREEIK